MKRKKTAPAEGNWTPGEWRSVGRDIVDEHGEIIAVAIGGASTAEARANAKLMGTSKQLLSTVEVLLTVIESETTHTVVKQARKLVRQLRGKRG